MELTKLMSVTDKVINEYEESLKHLDFLSSQIEKNQNLSAQLTEDIELFEEVRVFLQELAEVARHHVKSGLETIVTLCLQAVFGPTMSFEIDLDTSRNNTVVDFYVVSEEGGEIVRFPPEASMGGGVVDTCAIGLRFGMLKVLNPEPKGPVILDEPAKMVSGDLIDSISSLLQQLTQMFDKQNILVTHHVSLMDVVDNAIYFEKIDGVTVASKGS